MFYTSLDLFVIFYPSIIFFKKWNSHCFQKYQQAVIFFFFLGCWYFLGSLLLYECVYVYVYGCVCVFTQCAKLKFQFCDEQLKNKEKKKKPDADTQSETVGEKSDINSPDSTWYWNALTSKMYLKTFLLYFMVNLPNQFKLFQLFNISLWKMEQWPNSL